MSPNSHPFASRISVLLLKAIILASLLCSAACEIDTSISINENVPPTFSFSGSGYMTFFIVKEIAPENQNVSDVEQNSDRNNVIWWIWPNQEVDKPMSKLLPITYGEIPEGWNQREPKNGNPPNLIEGKVYEAGCVAASANGDYIRFIVRNGKAVDVPIPQR